MYTVSVHTEQSLLNTGPTWSNAKVLLSPPVGQVVSALGTLQERHIHTHAHTHTRMHTHIHTYIHTHTNTRTYRLTCTNKWTYLRILTHTLTCLAKLETSYLINPFSSNVWKYNNNIPSQQTSAGYPLTMTDTPQ